MLTKQNEKHNFSNKVNDIMPDGKSYDNQYGVIVDIEEGNKPESKYSGITRKFLIGKKFETFFGTWSWSWLNDNDTSDYKNIINGKLEDGRYFQVGGVKIRQLNQLEK